MVALVKRKNRNAPTVQMIVETQRIEERRESARPGAMDEQDNRSWVCGRHPPSLKA
jgi:hypothetical protein